MPQHFHAVVCIDHAGATIFDFTKDDFTEHRIEAKAGPGNIHHKAGSAGSGHAHDAKSYFAAVAAQLQPSHETLIVGHGTARTDFAHFIRDHIPALAARTMGIEAVDHSLTVKSSPWRGSSSKARISLRRRACNEDSRGRYCRRRVSDDARLGS